MDERMEWIGVDVGMPDDEVEVLTFCSGTEICRLAYHADGAWIDSQDGFTCGGITHWMDVIPPKI